MTELELLLRAAPPVAPERLRERVRALRPVARRVPSRRVVLLAFAALLVAALGAAAIRGLTSDTRERGDTAVLGGPAHAAATVPQDAREFSNGGAPTVAGPLPPPSGRLTQVLASLELRVDGTKRLADATASATRVARSLGGYAASVQYSTPAGEPGRAELELRIPTTNVQRALAQLSGLGTILSQELSTRDLERQLERQTAQIVQLREEIRLTLAALRDPALPADQRIRLQLKLNFAKRALAQRLHARKGTVSEGTLARVSLTLTTEKPAAAAHHRGRLGRMLGSAASFLALEGTIALYALIVLAPVLALAVLGWAALRLRRRRDERALLGAA